MTLIMTCDLLEHLNVMEPPLMLLVTPVCFLLWQVQMTAWVKSLMRQHKEDKGDTLCFFFYGKGQSSNKTSSAESLSVCVVAGQESIIHSHTLNLTPRIWVWTLSSWLSYRVLNYGVLQDTQITLCQVTLKNYFSSKLLKIRDHRVPNTSA